MDIFTENVSKDLVQVLQAIIILFVAAEAMFRGPFAKLRGVQEARMSKIPILALIYSAVRLATPLLLAALGGLFSERSGVINIGLEGLMLAGAFTAAVMTHYSNNPWVGLLSAILAGIGVALIHAVACIRYRADQVVSGTAINILFLGVPALLSGALFESTGATPQIPKDQLLPLAPIVLAFALVPVTWWVLNRTPFGLRLRAVGENPEAADTAGVNVARIRYAGVLLSGALAAIGGAYLSTGSPRSSPAT